MGNIFSISYIGESRNIFRVSTGKLKGKDHLGYLSDIRG
jgi:hypothetical protein